MNLPAPTTAKIPEPTINTCLITVPVDDGHGRRRMTNRFSKLPSRVHALTELIEQNNVLMLSFTSLDVVEAVGKSVPELDEAFFKAPTRIYLVAEERAPGQFRYVATMGEGMPMIELGREAAVGMLHGGELRLAALRLVLWAFAGKVWPAWRKKAKADGVRLRSVSFVTGGLMDVGIEPNPAAQEN